MMATTGIKKPSTTKKTTSKKTADDVNTTDTAEVKVETKVVKPDFKITNEDTVAVVSCVKGELMWKSPEGRKEVWNHFGDANPMTVSDLFKMRNYDQRFFSDNWVTIEGEHAQEYMDYLQVSKYYKNFKTVNQFDKIFDMSPDEIVNAVSQFSNETKETFARRAKEFMDEGKLDSYQRIEAIQKATGFDLHEDF
ncbi:MAG: hypothetical protein WCS17_12130 [Prevotella sp.]